ncbi:MAG TPA: POTRA domain-containing protein, partial [Rhodanobacteraceae bacterium]|nr:POTRA domain-containing protein [Rhodanobacteraceae bacterium]
MGYALAAIAVLVSTPIAHADSLKVAITGVDDQLAGAVRAAVSASQYVGRTNVTDTQARALADDAGGEAATALQPYGYYNADVAANLTRQGNAWTLHLQVNPGPATKVALLDLQVPDIAVQLPPVRKAVRSFHPRTGERMNDARYESSKGAIGTALVEHGWLDAQATMHRVEVTRATNSAAIHLHYKVGERYKLGAVSFKGSQFKPGFLQRYVPWQPGDWYSQANLLALQQALADADYFSIVDVQPEV